MVLKNIGLLALTLSLSTTVVADSDTQSMARNNAMLLGKTLKTELQTAMKADGPIAAIEVCNTKAMPLTDSISKESGWDIARTSLKVRNSDNAADAWEQTQLEIFEQRLAAGEPASQIEVFKEIVENGQTIQRFMKAIPTEEGCLACHGSELAQPIAEKLNQLYPNDQARGFAVGQLRGAFTLQRVIE